MTGYPCHTKTDDQNMGIADDPSDSLEVFQIVTQKYLIKFYPFSNENQKSERDF